MDSPSLAATESKNASQLLRRMLDGYQISALIYAATVLDLSRLVERPAADAEQAAAAAGWDPAAGAAFLNALASVGVVRFERGIGLVLTDLGKQCLPGRRDQIQPSLISFELLFRAWLDLPEMVRSGQPAFNRSHKESYWEYFARHPDVRHAFYRFVEGSLARYLDPILEALNIGNGTHVVDIGGATGSLLRGILDRWPDAKGTLFERREVIDDLLRSQTSGSFDPRIALVPGDVFASVPGGADVYVLCRILHDWSDRDASLILRNCAASMKSGSRLVLIEKLATSGIDRHRALHDLTMMLLFGGRERTAEEFRDLVEPAGFTVTGVVPTSSPLFVVQAVRRP